MDRETAHTLIRLTGEFYARNAASFSETRQSPWEGWRRVADLCAQRWSGLPKGTTLRVLDVACGNLRFERFLADSFPGLRFQVTAVDDCSFPGSLDLPANCVVQPVCQDVLTRLVDAPVDADAAAAGDGLGWGGGYDLVACFGFMHHVPGASARRALMDALVMAAAPNGVVAVSFWQFLNSPKLAAKSHVDNARHLQELAGTLDATQMEPGDFLLGWKDTSGSYRYCHSFSDEEIAGLAEGAPSGSLACNAFQADGATGSLNAYLVLAPQMSASS